MDDIDDKIIRMTNRHATRTPRPGGGKPAAIPAQHELSETERRAVIRNAMIAALLYMQGGQVEFTIEHLQLYWNTEVRIQGGTDEITGNPKYSMTLNGSAESGGKTNNRSHCSTCDGTGDVHRPDGEYLGGCQCKNPEEDPLRHAIQQLRTEVNCRIEHGAESGGHLEYVQDKLDSILEES